MDKPTKITRSIDDDGWIIRFANGESPRLYVRDTGGEWILDRNGVVGRQTRGTTDTPANMSAETIARWARVNNSAFNEGAAVEVRDLAGEVIYRCDRGGHQAA